VGGVRIVRGNRFSDVSGRVESFRGGFLDIEPVTDAVRVAVVNVLS
jgi:hypothetical protein